MNTLEKILNTPSASGRTEDMQKLLKEELCHITDENHTDVLGSISFTKKLGEGKKLMLCTAIDTPAVIATFTEKSKIFISPIGSYNPASLAFSHVKFENATGVLIPVSAFDANAGACDYVVQTASEKEAEKVVLGDVGVFDEKATILSDGKVFGFSSSAKICIYSAVYIAKKLLSQTCSLLSENGIGEVCFSFISQQSLGNRGSSCVSHAFNPDIIINLSPFDMTEKNTGSFDFEDGYAIKMLDRGFVADEEVSQFAEKILDILGIKHKRCVSNISRSALEKLSLSDFGAKCAEIGIPFKFGSTRGELSYFSFAEK